MAEDQVKRTEGSPDAGRRALLKAAAVAGGATAAAALLPGSWTKPVATIGGLPAHAQVSQALLITQAVAADYPLQGTGAVGASAAPWIYTRSRYDDPLGEFDNAVDVWTSIVGPGCEIEQNRVLASLSHFIDGDGFSGTVYFSTATNCSESSYIAWTFSKGGRTSNLVNCSIDTLNQTDL